MSSQKTPKGHELVSDDAVREAMRSARTLAVIGMKPTGAAQFVPEYMERHGYDVIPVNPNYEQLAQKTCIDRVDEIDQPVDMIVVFRRSTYLPDHAAEILKMNPLPKTVWMQLGIRSEIASQLLRDRGIDVVQSRCLKIEHARLLGS